MYFEVRGKRVFASTGGKPFDNKKPVVIFLHGSGLDHTFWALHSRFFAFRHYAVLALDAPGHTNSEGPPLATIEAQADWLHDVVGALELNNISIVAHSQGCLTALEYVSRHAQKLRSVTFITSGLATPVNPALIESAEKNPEAAIAMMVGWGFGRAGHLHQGPIPGNSMAAGGASVMRGNVPNALATDLAACNAYANGSKATSIIAAGKVPLQVLIAGQDRMAPQKATRQLVDALQRAEVQVVKDSGHMLPLEAPNQCRQMLKTFIFKNNPAV